MMVRKTPFAALFDIIKGLIQEEERKKEKNLFFYKLSKILIKTRHIPQEQKNNPKAKTTDTQTIYKKS